MSTNFSANQFESAFVSSRLQNYEVPRPHKERPSMRKRTTQIIANDRGHIVDTDRRSPTKGAWGHFMGTWQIPRKPIQLKVTTKFMSQSYRASRPASAMFASTPIEERDNTPDKDRSCSPDQHDKSISSDTNRSGSKSSNRSSSKASNHPHSKASSRSSSQGNRSQTSMSVPRSSHSSKTNSRPVTEGESIPLESHTCHSSCDHDRSSQCQSRDKSSTQTPCHSGSVVSRYTPQTPISSRTQSAPNIRSSTSGSSCGHTHQICSRPHSRQGSVQASGIVTPSQVYTPTPSEGSYHTHIATEPVSKGIQCPSIDTSA